VPNYSYLSLPYIEDYRPGNDGVAPLAKHKEFYETTCSGCGGKAIRETDVSDTFLDSSWYFLRYPSVGIARELPFDPAITKKWLPVDMYTGGAEHSVLHLMYSRFVTMALKDWGYIDFDEPFTRFYAHGLVIKNGVKMSKSKGNVVNPDEYIAMYGADALRLYLMFMGPYDQGGDFRDSAMEGMSRWVGRIWRLGLRVIDKKTISSKAVVSALQKLIGKLTDDMEKRRYNTAIASMMEFTNLVNDQGGAIGQEEYKTFLLLLAPFAPHLTEELWSRLQDDDQSIHLQPWPTSDASLTQEESIAFVVQVNGKLRDTLTMKQETGLKRDEVETLARSSAKIQNHLADKKIIKVIFVPGKLLNFVV
jgi:leucyl-tRNA synthetase